MGNRRDFRADRDEPVDPKKLFVFVRHSVPAILVDVGNEDIGARASRQWSRSGYHDRDRGTPRGATPPSPPGIRVRTTAVRLG